MFHVSRVNSFFVVLISFSSVLQVLYSVSESEKLAQAFLEACQHGTHPSYRARINIIGHSGAGKTSLTRRLLRQKFQKGEESTDGIETHRIEFDFGDSPLGPIVWSEAELEPEHLSKQFSSKVLQERGKIDEKTEQSTSVQSLELDKRMNITKTKRTLEDTKTQPGTHSQRRKLAADSTVVHEPQAHSRPMPQTAGVRQEIIDQLKAASKAVSASPQVQSTNEVKGVIRLWDFGGQTEFYTTHHMFLDADAINIIVMDISKPLKSKLIPKERSEVVGIPSTQEEFLCYWLRSIQASAEAKQKKSKTILVFTHLDMIPRKQSQQYVDDFKNEVKEIVASMKVLEIPESDMYFVDNKEGSNDSFRKLRLKLQHLIIGLPTWGMKRPVSWLKLEADMREKVNKANQKHIKFDEVKELAKDSHMSPDEVESFLLFLHTMGDVVFYSDPILRDVVILDPQWLVNVFKAIITAEEFIATRMITGEDVVKTKWLVYELLQLLDTGVISHRCLHALWQEDDTNFLIELLQKFHLILQVGSATAADRTFLIPCMLPKPKEGDWRKVEFSQNFNIAFKSSHTAPFEELFPLDTFPKLVAACAKSWQIREEGLLSLRHVSYEISDGVVLALTQSHRSSITTTIWFNPTVHQRNPLHTVLNAKPVLAGKLSACRIPPSPTAEIICPHWTRRDYHICTVGIGEAEDQAASPGGQVKANSPKCTCHEKVLDEAAFSKPSMNDGREMVTRPLVYLDQVRVSKHLTNGSMVETVAAHLGLPDNTVKCILYDCRHHINEAGLEVLHQFRRQMSSGEEAFEKLWEALVKSGLDNVAWEVLGKE